MFSKHIPGWQRAALGCPWAADGAVDKTVQLTGDELGWHGALQRRSSVIQLRDCTIIIAIIKNSNNSNTVIVVVAVVITFKCLSMTERA